MDNNPIPNGLRFESERLQEIRLHSDSNPGIPASFSQEVELIMFELSDLLISKHKDYGPKNISQSPGGPLNGLRVRMHDKLARINNLIDNGKDPKYEPLEDSFKDLANYAVIALMVMRNKWGE